MDQFFKTEDGEEPKTPATDEVSLKKAIEDMVEKEYQVVTDMRALKKK
jgi:hypothetical protein